MKRFEVWPVALQKEPDETDIHIAFAEMPLGTQVVGVGETPTGIALIAAGQRSGIQIKHKVLVVQLNDNAMIPLGVTPGRQLGTMMSSPPGMPHIQIPVFVFELGPWPKMPETLIGAAGVKS